MTTMTFSSTYISAAYALSSSYDTLVITSSATFGGGVSSNHLTTVDNYGTVRNKTAGGTAIALTAGGLVTNGNDSTLSALVRGAVGIAISGAAGTVDNFGTVAGTTSQGVVLSAGGTVVNGDTLDSSASISGSQGVNISGGAGSVTNFGSIRGGDFGVELQSGGLANGDPSSTSATIQALTGVYMAQSTGESVANFATIKGTSGYGVKFGSAAGSSSTADMLTNGSPSDTTALIQGVGGVYLQASSTLTNFGTIIGLAAGANPLDYGVKNGTVINGALTDRSALIEGALGGVDANSVQNYGTIVGLKQRGVLANIVVNGSGDDTQATIEAGRGWDAVEAATVTNFGTLEGGASGNTVTNGSGSDTVALISGSYSGVATDWRPSSVANFGTIVATGGHFAKGVYLYGSTLTNGTNADHGALVAGYTGVVMFGNSVTGLGSVANFGTIQGTGLGKDGDGLAEAGVSVLGYGARITSGSLTDTSALIEGYDGIELTNGGPEGPVSGPPDVITNLGTIKGLGQNGYSGIASYLATTITNGAVADKQALMTGYDGVSFYGAAGTVTNFGTVDGTGGALSSGIALRAGGTITNGGTADKVALIEGYDGIKASFTTLTNFASVQGIGGLGYYGAVFSGGKITNGSTAATQALIAGYGGVEMIGGTVTNLGTVLGQGEAGGIGVALSSGARLNEGSSARPDALVQGFIGVSANGPATVDAFGTITGTGGTAVLFNSANDVLLVRSSAVFNGVVNGGAGTIDFVSGSGTISGLSAAGSLVAAENGGATTTFSNFGTVVVDSGVSFVVSGNGTVPGRQGTGRRRDAHRERHLDCVGLAGDLRHDSRQRHFGA